MRNIISIGIKYGKTGIQILKKTGKIAIKVGIVCVIWPVSYAVSFRKVHAARSNPQFDIIPKAILHMMNESHEEKELDDIRRTVAKAKLKKQYGLGARYYDRMSFFVYTYLYIMGIAFTASELYGLFIKPKEDSLLDRSSKAIWDAYYIHTIYMILPALIFDFQEKTPEYFMTCINNILFPLAKLLKGPNAKNCFGSTELHMAVSRQDLSEVRSLMTPGKRSPLLETDSLEKLQEMIAIEDDPDLKSRKEIARIWEYYSKRDELKAQSERVSVSERSSASARSSVPERTSSRVSIVIHQFSLDSLFENKEGNSTEADSELRRRRV